MNIEYFTEYEFNCTLDQIEKQYEWFSINHETLEQQEKIDPDYTH